MIFLAGNLHFVPGAMFDYRTAIIPIMFSGQLSKKKHVPKQSYNDPAIVVYIMFQTIVSSQSIGIYSKIIHIYIVIIINAG